MRKKLFTGLFAVALIISVFASGCAQEANIEVTVVPSETAKPRAETLVPAGAAEPTDAGATLPSGEITDETFTADLDSDGNEETISFSSTEVEYEGWVDYLTVMTVWGASETYAENIEGCTYESCYFIRTQSGKVCLLVSLECFIDYGAEIYSFDGIKPVRLCGLGHVTGVSGTDITQEGAVDVFGTWHYSQAIKLNDDLSLERGELEIIMDDRMPLRTSGKLPVEYLKNGVYSKGYVDKGKDIIPLSTDGKSYLWFRLEDGTEGRILYTYVNKDDSFDTDNDPYYSICLINGKSEFEYFENIDYTDTLY